MLPSSELGWAGTLTVAGPCAYGEPGSPIDVCVRGSAIPCAFDPACVLGTAIRRPPSLPHHPAIGRPNQPSNITSVDFNAAAVMLLNTVRRQMAHSGASRTL